VAHFPMGGGPEGHYEDPQIYTDKVRGAAHRAIFWFSFPQRTYHQ
jgi:hypothetical protein